MACATGVETPHSSTIFTPNCEDCGGVQAWQLLYRVLQIAGSGFERRWAFVADAAASRPHTHVPLHCAWCVLPPQQATACASPSRPHIGQGNNADERRTRSQPSLADGRSET